MMNRYRLLDLLRHTDIVRKSDEYYSLVQREDVRSYSLDKQRDNLIAFLKRLRSNSFYHEYLGRVSDEEIERVPYDVLKLLPIVDKSVLAQNYFFIRNKEYRGENDYTGGSTGSPFHYFVGKKELSSLGGFTLFLWRYLAGYHWGDDTIVIGGTSIGDKMSLKKRVLHFLQRRVYVSGGEITSKNAFKLAAMINGRDKPFFLYGYPSSICQYIQLFESLGIEVKTNAIKCIISTSEVLSERRKGRMESFFKTKVINLYGARDGGISAGSTGNDYFIYNGLECVAENVEFEGVRELVLTNLDSDAFPFVRYRIGDIGELSIAESGYPFILTGLQGRTRDFIHLSPTKKIHGSRINKVFKDLPILEYQIIQHKDYSCDIRIQPVAPLSQKEMDLVRERFLALLDDVPFRIIIESHLERGRNNKLRNIISEVESD